MTTKHDVSHKRRSLLKGIGAGTLVLAGAHSTRLQAQAKLRKMEIFIGTTPHFGNVIIGAEKGFYEKEGLPVTITNFASGSVAADAFRAGKGHLVVTGDLPAMRLWNQGNIGICPQANYGDLSIIVARSHIKSAADMRGRKIGVLIGSTSEFFAQIYLTRGNVKLNEVDLINLRPAEMVTGLARGDIDAFVIWQPFGWRALAAVKDAHILTTGRGYFHEWEAVTTTREYANSHAAEIGAFLRGLDAAGKWIPGNLDEAAKLVAAQIRLDDPRLARDMMEKIDWNIAYSKKFRQDMEFMSKFIKIKLDWNTMFDQRFLAKLGSGYVE
ncbi:MAG TPA: ABC transporter substrate-binding protein [Burkholderiales bacterium]|nr:ABC transporter substrate-binding protein [Burkholderiales bacterium]